MCQRCRASPANLVAPVLWLPPLSHRESLLRKPHFPAAPYERQLAPSPPPQPRRKMTTGPNDRTALPQQCRDTYRSEVGIRNLRMRSHRKKNRFVGHVRAPLYIWSRTQTLFLLPNHEASTLHNTEYSGMQSASTSWPLPLLSPLLFLVARMRMSLRSLPCKNLLR